jgi:hypothetical protein
MSRSLKTGDQSALNPGGNGDQESKSRNEDPTTALLTRLRQAFFDIIQDPVRNEAEARAHGQYHSRIALKAVLATLGAFELRYDLPVVFAETPEAAALQVERWIWWFAYETTVSANDLLRGCEKESF